MAEPFMGMISTFGFNFPPRGWAQCNGQLMPIAQFDALFSLLGTTYGGDGVNTFALPDLRGRTAVSPGQSPGTNINWQLGQMVGVESVALTIVELPAHSHALNCSNAGANQPSPSNHITAVESSGSSATYSDGAPGTTMKAGSIGPSGGGQAHENMQPYLTINFCIALEGIYPSRS